MAAAAAVVLLAAAAAVSAAQPQLVEVRRFSLPFAASRVEIAPDGVVYALSQAEHRLARADRGSAEFRTTGGFGWGLDALDAPAGLSLDGLSVYVADRNNHRVMRYDRHLRPLTSLSTRDTSDARVRFGYPRAVAVNGRGDVAIIDGDRQDVVVLDRSGRPLFRFGRDARPGRPFAEPVDVVSDGEGRWLVLEQSTVWRVDMFGTIEGSADHGLHRVHSVAAAGQVWVAGPESLVVFSADLRQKQAIAFAHAFIGGDPGPVADIALHGSTMFVAVGRTLIECSVTEDDLR